MSWDTRGIVTHFVFGKWKIKRKENHNRVSEIKIEPAAFEPHPGRNDLSVFEISDLKSKSDERSVWFIGKFVEKGRHEAHYLNHGHNANDPSNMYGRGDLNVQEIQELGLQINEKFPPPRHANITEFPIFSRGKDSASFKIQQKLADRAEGFLIREVSPDITDILNENVGVRPEFFEHL